MENNKLLGLIIFFLKKHRLNLIAIGLNAIAILFVYQSVFKLELEGDTWQYAWGHQITYHSNVFSQESIQGMRTSLAGASLTFGLLQNNFGLNPLVYYSVSLALKFISVVSFYFLVKKFTNNYFASVIASLILSVTYAGVEATHWVFNMYAYIGLTLLIWSIYYLIDLPYKFNYKSWKLAFILACLAVWYATMRTNGIIPLAISWSSYKYLTLRTKDSFKNLKFWFIGIPIFILIDKFLLGQMETGYSQTYIIGEGLRAIKVQTEAGKYDFFLSSASNFGISILPDITWNALNFQKIFSFLGSSLSKSVLLPSFLIFVLFNRVLTSLLTNSKENIWRSDKFIKITSLGLLWTTIIYFISKLGPLNYSTFWHMEVALFGGYFIILALFLGLLNKIPSNLKDLFLISFIWSFAFLLLPLFQNGGQIFGTPHRYMVTTAPSIALLIGGLISLGYHYKSYSFKLLILFISFWIVLSHGFQTKAFFDRKALVHNRELSAKIWRQFTEVVPNKSEYLKNNQARTESNKAPNILFLASNNPIDQETLFETLYFGFLFQASIKYDWDPHLGAGLYHQNYPELVKDVKKNPQMMDELYAVGIQNQELINLTAQVKEQLTKDIQQ